MWWIDVFVEWCDSALRWLGIRELVSGAVFYPVRAGMLARWLAGAVIHSG